MERFVFFAAIAFAVIFAIGTLADGPDFGFHIDVDGEAGVAAMAEPTADRLEPQAFAGETLRLRHLAANVIVLPEDRTDFLIEIDSPGGAPMPQVSAEDGRVTVDGQLRGRIADCSVGGAELRGYGALTSEQLPRITIRAPRALIVTRSGAGTTEIGAAQSVDLDLSGCSSVTIADVAGALNLSLSGSGEVRAGAAESLKAAINGSGDLAAGAIANGAQIEVNGSGGVVVAAVTGDASIATHGSGGASIQGGQIAALSVDIMGSGDVDISAPVERLGADIFGSGDVTVNGIVGDLEVDIFGSGSVSADQVTGSVQRDIMGSGDVRIGG